MIKKYFLPNGDALRGVWLSNFDAKLGTYATKFGIVKADTDSVHNDTLAFNFTLTLIAAAKSYEHNCATFKTSIRNGIDGKDATPFPVFTIAVDTPTAVATGLFSRISTIVKAIKANKFYTEAIGKDLGIIGSDIAPKGGTDTIQPIITGKTSGGSVIIKYTKGDTGGIRLECKRSTETDFSLVDKTTKSVYTDDRANLIPGKPEQREYRAWYVVDDDITGQVSDVMIIVVPAT